MAATVRPERAVSMALEKGGMKSRSGANGRRGSFVVHAVALVARRQAR